MSKDERVLQDYRYHSTIHEHSTKILFLVWHPYQKFHGSVKMLSPISRKKMTCFEMGRCSILNIVYGALPTQFPFNCPPTSQISLVTSVFLHGGLMHLGGNMLFLWIFGDNIEHKFGRGKFFIIYMAWGIILAKDAVDPANDSSGGSFWRNIRSTYEHICNISTAEFVIDAAKSFFCSSVLPGYIDTLINGIQYLHHSRI